MDDLYCKKCYKYNKKFIRINECEYYKLAIQNCDEITDTIFNKTLSNVIITILEKYIQVPDELSYHDAECNDDFEYELYEMSSNNTMFDVHCVGYIFNTIFVYSIILKHFIKTGSFMQTSCVYQQFNEQYTETTMLTDADKSYSVTISEILADDTIVYRCIDHIRSVLCVTGDQQNTMLQSFVDTIKKYMTV